MKRGGEWLAVIHNSTANLLSYTVSSISPPPLCRGGIDHRGHPPETLPDQYARVPVSLKRKNDEGVDKEKHSRCNIVVSPDTHWHGHVRNFCENCLLLAVRDTAKEEVVVFALAPSWVS